MRVDEKQIRVHGLNMTSKELNELSLRLSSDFFLHCYLDQFDSLIVGIKRLWKEKEEKESEERLRKQAATKSCPEDAWLPIPQFEMLEQNAGNLWANLLDTHGRTLLHYCCGSKQELAPLAARYLLDSKASLLICDADGNFPVHYLARQGNVLMFERCSEFLRVVGQRSKNNLAQTAYEIARSKGHTSLLSFLLAKCPWIAADMQIREGRKKEARKESFQNSPKYGSRPTSAHSQKNSSSRQANSTSPQRRPSSARSPDSPTHSSPTGSKRNSVSNISLEDEDSGKQGPFELDYEQLDDLVEQITTDQDEQSDVDELYRITCEFPKWDPLMSKALVLRWIDTYVRTRGSCLDIILKPHCGHSAIHLAVINGCDDALIILLKYGASTDVQNDRGHTPLHLACMLGFANMVRELLKIGADVHRQDQDGCIPIELIPNTHEGIQIVVLLFRFASTLSIDDDEREQSLLEIMIDKQHFDIVNLLLLMRPWSAFHINRQGETLLHCVAQARFDQTAVLTGKVLVALGVDTKLKNAKKLIAVEVCSELYSPLSVFLSDSLAIHIQRMQSIWHLVQLTELGYWNDQKIFDASSKKFLSEGDSGKAMTLKGSSVSIKLLHKIDSDCNNLLHRACSLGAEALAQKLLNSGLADLPHNLNGDTPLHIAAFGGHNEIILCLFAASFSKALMHATNKHGFTAFDLAAFQGHLPVLATFLSWGYIETFEKNSPKSLLGAIIGRRWHVVVYLLENLPHESKLCSDKDDNNFLHYFAALNEQESIQFFDLLPLSKCRFLFDKRCLKKQNAIKLDPFDMAGRNQNVTFLSSFRKYCACCIVSSSKQFLARRSLMKLHHLANLHSTGVWKVKGYSTIITQGFVLWTVLGAIVEILEEAIFIRKIMPNGMAKLIGLTVGASITQLWDLDTYQHRVVRIVKQSHSEHFNLHGLLAVKLPVNKGIHGPGDADDDCIFHLENGDLVRLSAHEYQDVPNANIFKFAATESNQVSVPFSYSQLLKMKGPHMMMTVVSLTGAHSCSEAKYLLKNVVTRAELQAHFHPESDAISNLLFAPLENVQLAVSQKGIRKRASLEFGAASQAHAEKEALAALQGDADVIFTAEDLFFGADDGDLDVTREILYRPDIELFESVEKLDTDVILPCTIIAAVNPNCLQLGGNHVLIGDQIIAIQGHRTINCKTAQRYMEGKKDGLVSLTVARTLQNVQQNDKKVSILHLKLVRTTPNSWLSWVESTLLLQQNEEKTKIDATKTPHDSRAFAEILCNQQLAACESVVNRASFEELSRVDGLPMKHMRYRLNTCSGMFVMKTTAADRIKAVYRAHIVRRSIICNFTIRQSLSEKSRSTERVLMTNGLAIQMVVDWINSGLLGVSPLLHCIQNGNSDGLLQLMHYGFGSRTSWCNDVRTATTFYSLMDSAVENKASKACLILVQEQGLLSILENSSYTQSEKAIFVMTASIKYCSVDVLKMLVENPSVMQCVGENNFQAALTMAIEYGRVQIVEAILQERPRLSCLRLPAFPNETALRFILMRTKYPGTATHQLSFDFVTTAMLFSFVKSGCVLFSQNTALNPLSTYLAPTLVDCLENFATFREAEVLKAIANGMSLRCRRRNEEKLVDELKRKHAQRQAEIRAAQLAKKHTGWSKIGAKQEMVTLASNFRRMGIESNMEQELARELSHNASRMRIAGKEGARTDVYHDKL